MVKKIEKLFKSYRDQLIHLAKLYGIVEVKSYERSAKRLTISQLELLLIKNRIKIPINRSSNKAIEKQELKENSIRNVYLAFAFIFFVACMITMRPYIKNIVNEVKFTYVAEEYKTVKVWGGQKPEIGLGVASDQILTLPRSDFKNLQINYIYKNNIQAPIKKGDVFGSIEIISNDNPVLVTDLVALDEVEAKGFFGRLWSKFILWIMSLFGG